MLEALLIHNCLEIFIILQKNNNNNTKINKQLNEIK